MSQSSEELIRGLYAAFGRGEVPAVLAMLDEDIEWHAPANLPHGGDFRGRERSGVSSRASASTGSPSRSTSRLS